VGKRILINILRILHAFEKWRIENGELKMDN